MANGVYGTNIPASISDNDISKYVDIFYSYSPSRNSSDVSNTVFHKLDTINLRNVLADVDGVQALEGLYNLKLPSSIFGKKGFYTIYIKPKEVKARILDVSTLRDYSDVTGIILDTRTMDENLRQEALVNNGLVGYRITYINSDGSKSPEYRIVTSNNKCEPVISVTDTTNATRYSYVYNENSDFTFLTVTPSMSLSFKANSTPFIGKATQDIYLTNTLFAPVCLEIEMVEHDIETVSTMLEGSQVRDLNNGLVTTFTKDNQIYHQSAFSTLKTSATGAPQYEVKENKSNNIDFTQTITDKLAD